jgi:transcriptional regulator
LQKKDNKKGYESYGIISEIMPFSDKREIKIRYKITELIENLDRHNSTMNLKEWKAKITEWIGMVFRATASICWNMLLNDSLNFE